MNRYAGRRPAPPTATEMHRSWLELVDTDGPFLAIAPIKRVWPNGMPDFRHLHPDRYAMLSDAHKAFVSAWDRLDLDPSSEKQQAAYRTARDTWVQTVLRDVVGWKESLEWGEVPGVEALSPDHAVTVKAQAALTGGDGRGALVRIVDPVDSLRESPPDRWAATEIDRMEELLRSSGVPVGIVTDGRWWGLVSAKPGSMPASGIVDALTWVEEPRTRDAFLAILGRQYLIGGDPSERLPALFEESIAAAEEITEALGVQVRRAVELLVQSFSESSLEARRRGQPEPLPERTHSVYEAAVTIMMRTVFLLFAEERGLLPSGELFDEAYGMSGELTRLAARESGEGEESLDSTSLSWHRLLATCNALYSGATFEGLRMPAYGGSLFDPARFPWLTAVTDDGTLAVTVSDRVMLHMLRSVQLAVLKGGEARQISFRDIDVEQIGYIYEGLLGYTAVRVDRTYVGLRGSGGSEPEIPLETLEEMLSRNGDPKGFAEAIRAWVEQDQPAAKAQSASAIAKGLTADVDPGVVSSLGQAVGGDVDLRKRIKPWLGVMRQDLRSHPFVVLPGGLLVKETPSRKNAGAHYTPKSLAEEVVLYALQPLCYSPGPHQTGNEAEWRLRPSEEILDLKVADIACGSGAFLVAAARYLADRVTEAWIAEDPDNAYRKDLHLRAMRQVVASCLYGADINEMAVEMAKLSLWLVSLDRDLPFSFVDDKVFLGNSLLGLTSLDQLRALHIDPSRAGQQQALDIFHVDVDGIIRKAIDLRERLASEIDENDPARSATAKRRQFAQLQGVTAQLRELANGVIAAGLPLGGMEGKALDEAFENLRLAVKDAQSTESGGKGDASWLESVIRDGLTPSVATDYDVWQPLHWVLEAPDVHIDHGGFDAVIGNPPFLGGQKLTGAMGTEMRGWLVNVLAHGQSGSADLVAYFFLRAAELLRDTGTLGLIATNTIAQGVTKEVGLDQMVRGGFTITRAIRSRPWPARSANLEFAGVWGSLVDVDSSVLRSVDGELTSGISTLLGTEGSVVGDPIRLAQNEGIAFQGAIPRGAGFVVEDWEAADWIASDGANAEVLFPYLNGKDLNSRPDGSASRWVINFDSRTVTEAASYRLPFDRVQQAVMPDRLGNKDRAVREHPWWRFWRTAPALREAIKGRSEVLAIAQVSSTLMPSFVSADQVLDAMLVVFATDSAADLALLSSEVHRLWALTYGTTMRTDARYTPSTIFETLPRPAMGESLIALGEQLDTRRREVMIRRGEGLTKLYGHFNSPECLPGRDADIDWLRGLHGEIDEAVLTSYGWTDIELDHGFHEYRGVVRWSVSPVARGEILDRLLEENHRRAALEAAAGPTPKKGRKGRALSEPEETLFS